MRHAEDTWMVKLLLSCKTDVIRAIVEPAWWQRIQSVFSLGKPKHPRSLISQQYSTQSINQCPEKRKGLGRDEVAKTPTKISHRGGSFTTNQKRTK